MITQLSGGSNKLQTKKTWSFNPCFTTAVYPTYLDLNTDMFTYLLF